MFDKREAGKLQDRHIVPTSQGGQSGGRRQWEALRCCDVLRVSHCQRLTDVEGVRHKGLTHTKTLHEDVGMSSIRADPSYITCNSYSSAAFIVPSLKLHIGGVYIFPP